MLVDFALAEGGNSPELPRFLDLVRRLVQAGSDGKEVAGTLLTYLIVGLEALAPEATQQVIDYLAELAGLNVGTSSRPIAPSRKPLSSDDQLYGLLMPAIYAEVKRFCTARKAVIHDEYLALVERIGCPVISVGSRKGGTGKSILLAAIVGWFKQRQPTANICIFDLDLSGPIWQYLLFPQRNRPEHYLHYLDEAIELNQPPTSFDFGDPNPDEILSLVEKAPCPFGLGGDISHLGVRDLPGISRILIPAAEMSRGYFYPFLAKVIESLSKRFDAVLVDNGPGFDSIPFCAHAIAGSVKVGATFIVSTPALPDLAGTFLELADLRLLELIRPPVWIVNKATEGSRAFLSRGWTAYEIAKKLQAYDGVLPDAPLVERFLRPPTVSALWHSVSMDTRLLDFAFLDEAGMPRMPQLRGTVFAQDVEAVLEKVLAPMLAQAIPVCEEGRQQ
jgi:cellulose biosynthesis protein BcsQ